MAIHEQFHKQTLYIQICSTIPLKPMLERQTQHIQQNHRKVDPNESLELLQSTLEMNLDSVLDDRNVTIQSILLQLNLFLLNIEIKKIFFQKKYN